MARGGQQPKPTELKLLEGNPGHRPLNNKPHADIPVTMPPAPAHLGKAGKAHWELYWTHGRVWLAASDIPVVTQLCEAHDEAERIAEVIRKEGFTQVNKTTGRSATHYLYNDLRGLRREMRELWSLCYMTPTDRGRGNVQAPVVDPLAEWAAQ